MKESQRKAMFARFKLNYRTPNGINYKTINYGNNFHDYEMVDIRKISKDRSGWRVEYYPRQLTKESVRHEFKDKKQAINFANKTYLKR